MYQVSLAFRFRGREETLTGVAECGDGTPKDSLLGGAVCAGPGEKASHLALNGDRVLVMRIPAGVDLWAPGPIDQRHDTVKNPFGADDTEFRLVRTGLKQCEDLAFDRQKPLPPTSRETTSPDRKPPAGPEEQTVHYERNNGGYTAAACYLSNTSTPAVGWAQRADIPRRPGERVKSTLSGSSRRSPCGRNATQSCHCAPRQLCAEYCGRRQGSR
jgi:hypothetical protein